MKVSTFHLDLNDHKSQYPLALEVDVKVPILPAYAIHHAFVDFECAYGGFGEVPKPRYEVLHDSVVVRGEIENMFTPLNTVLTIHHAGVKDYSLLFPHVEEEGLRQRLGQFAQEAETAFESQSWMAYVLMVASVIEGVLYNEFSKDNLVKLIDRALNNNLITEDESKVLHELRKYRNRVHANLYDEPFADRKIALELSVVYDRFLKRNWLHT